MPSKHYDIFEFNLDNLAKALSNNISPYTELREYKKVEYLHDYLNHGGIDSKTIIVENKYVDGDYLDDYSSYYAKCFYPYRRICKRLHFFSEEYNEIDLLSFIENAKSKDKILLFQNAYRGFIVARPLPKAVIGRTVLVPYPAKVERNYPCIKDCRANLFGIDLFIRSLEFQEQDAVMSACATVSVWCSLQKAAELFRTSAPTPATITVQATQVVDEYRSIPNNGLILKQINKAILNNGLVAEIIKLDRDVPILSLLYSYLRAEIPVILGVHIEGKGLHAITLVGYSSEDNSFTTPYQPDEVIPHKANKISKLYAHDDQIGPFSRLEFNRILNKDGLITFTSSWEDNQEKLITLTPKLIIIPLYHKIRITYIDIYKFLNNFSVIVIEDEQLLKFVEKKKMKLQWDVYLTTTNHLKQHEIETSPQNTKELKDVLFFAHPHYIWHAILYNGDAQVMELMADTTDIPNTFPFYYVVWHDIDLKNQISQALDNLEEDGLLENIATTKFKKLLQKGPEGIYPDE